MRPRTFRQAGRCAQRALPRTTACRSSSRRIRARRSASRSAARRFHANVQLLKPLGFHDYVKLQLIGARSAVGQRHDQRGIVDPELPRAESARGA